MNHPNIQELRGCQVSQLALCVLVLRAHRVQLHSSLGSASKRFTATLCTVGIRELVAPHVVQKGLHNWSCFSCFGDSMSFILSHTHITEYRLVFLACLFVCNRDSETSMHLAVLCLLILAMQPGSTKSRGPFQDSH